MVRQNRFRRLLTLGVLLTLALHGVKAQTMDNPTAPITLRLKYTPGETLRYRFAVAMVTTFTTNKQATPADTHPMHQQVTVDYTDTVQSVSPADGSATLLQHINRMTSLLNGKSVPIDAALAAAYKDGVTVTVAPTGKVLAITMPPSVKGKLPPDMYLSLMSGLSPLLLPPGPVRNGDTWNGAAPTSLSSAALGTAKVKMSSQCTLAALDAGATPTAEIRQTSTETLSDTLPVGMTAKGQVTLLSSITGLIQFDVNNGSLISQDGTSTTSTTSPSLPGSASAARQTLHMTIQTTTHLVRLPDDVPTP